MDRRNITALFVLVVVLAGFELLPRVLPGAEPADLEEGSDRIGWRDPFEADALARDIHTRVNDERRERGLQPLAWHAGLAEIARAWSVEMISTGYRHSTPEYRSHPEFAGTGENIYMGPRSTNEAHVGWMRSAGHRDNILDPNYSAVGIGLVCRNDGHIWATQIFGAPHGMPPQPRLLTSEEPIVRLDPGLTCP